MIDLFAMVGNCLAGWFEMITWNWVAGYKKVIIARQR